MDECSACGSKELEKLSEIEIICKNCGYGFATGKETTPHLIEYVKKLQMQVLLLKALFPNDTKEQLNLRFKFHLHRVEKHPVSHTFCEYCNIDWSRMSKEEFKERLGYNKDDLGIQE